MGNRAIVIFAGRYDVSPAIDLHWNGGAESIYPFLEELAMRGGEGEGSYTTARFIQVVADFFDSDKRTNLSIGVLNGPEKIDLEHLSSYDPGDNGIFVIERFYKDYKMQQRVRRFKTTRDDILREWTEEEVERERAEALAHRYNESIRETFRDIDRKLYGGDPNGSTI